MRGEGVGCILGYVDGDGKSPVGYTNGSGYGIGQYGYGWTRGDGRSVGFEFAWYGFPFIDGSGNGAPGDYW